MHEILKWIVFCHDISVFISKMYTMPFQMYIIQLRLLMRKVFCRHCLWISRDTVTQIKIRQFGLTNFQSNAAVRSEYWHCSKYNVFWSKTNLALIRINDPLITIIVENPKSSSALENRVPDRRPRCDVVKSAITLYKRPFRHLLGVVTYGRDSTGSLSFFFFRGESVCRSDTKRSVCRGSAF